MPSGRGMTQQKYDSSEKIGLLLLHGCNSRLQRTETQICCEKLPPTLNLASDAAKRAAGSKRRSGCRMTVT